MGEHIACARARISVSSASHWPRLMAFSLSAPRVTPAKAGLEHGWLSQYIAQVGIPPTCAIRAFGKGSGNRPLGFIGRTALEVLPSSGIATI